MKVLHNISHRQYNHRLVTFSIPQYSSEEVSGEKPVSTSEFRWLSNHQCVLDVFDKGLKG